KIPLAVEADQDPFEIKAVFLPVDDGETRITQSLMERTMQASAAIAEQAVALSVDYVTLLPMYYYQGATPYRVLCEPIPVAGTGAGATLLSVGAPAFVSNSPVSYASDGSSDNITSPSSFSATFSGAVG